MEKQKDAIRLSLVVEDNKIQQKLLKCYLEQLNYQVEVVECADIAIKLITNKSYALILTDLGLPDQSGEIVIQAVRASQLNQSVPVIVCTAHASKEKERECLELGANKVLIKPIKLEVLEQAIKIF